MVKMAEYIKRKKVYKMLNALGGCGADPGSWANGWDKAIDTAIEELEEIPAADVRPERHGHWIIYSGLPFCSECDCNNLSYAVISFDYCPNCGARMDGDKNDRAKIN